MRAKFFARAYGFDTDHWTLERITTVIERLTGTRYHPGHTWKLLRRMGWVRKHLCAGGETVRLHAILKGEEIDPARHQVRPIRNVLASELVSGGGVSGPFSAVATLDP